jgi:2-methylcitrate dehydratase PrpD
MTLGLRPCSRGGAGENRVPRLRELDADVTSPPFVDELARFVAHTRFDNLPAAVVAKAKRHILDTFGAALAGARSEEAQQTSVALAAADGAGRSPAWGTSLAFSPRNAALVNGIAAHAFELDDTGGCDHSGAVVLPAAIAALDTTDRLLSGRDLVTAVVLGYDLGRRVLEGFGGYKPHNAAGWHSTGTCGTFAAAAAAASILGLDARALASALGLAASFSSGLWAFIHDGAMAKRVHAGRAAEGGLLAALLAAGGITGPMHVFEDVWGGFFKTFAAAAPDPEALTRDLGRTWAISRAAIKPYASCRDTHAAVDAVARVLDRHNLKAADVTEIRVRANAFLAGMVGGRAADTLPAAQMSLPYAVAARTVFGSAGLSAYSTTRRHDPVLRAMLDRVLLDIDETVVGSDSSTVKIALADGTEIEEATRPPRGSPENPLDDEDLVAKFAELAEPVLDAGPAQVLLEFTLALERMPDARVLLGLLGSARPAAASRGANTARP